MKRIFTITLIFIMAIMSVACQTKNETVSVQQPKAEVVKIKLQDGTLYHGMAIKNVPEGPGLIIKTNEYPFELLAYGYFVKGKLDNTRSVKIKEGSSSVENSPQFKFSMNDGVIINRAEMGKGFTYLQGQSEGGIAGLFGNEILKISLEPTEVFYFGKLKDNRPDGYGKIYMPFTSDLYVLVYSGDFKKGKISGAGSLYYGDGSIKYEGDLKDGVFNGSGKEYYVDGKVHYEGEWEKGMYVKGILYYPNGNIQYEGEWKKSIFSDTTQKSGKGKLYFDNGRLNYEGSWKNDVFNGKGKLYDEDGAIKYEGKFKDGVPE